MVSGRITPTLLPAGTVTEGALDDAAALLEAADTVLGDLHTALTPSAEPELPEPELPEPELAELESLLDPPHALMVSAAAVPMTAMDILDVRIFAPPGL